MTDTYECKDCGSLVVDRKGIIQNQLKGMCGVCYMKPTDIPGSPGVDCTDFGVYPSITGADPVEDKASGGWSSDYYKIPQDAKELGDLINHRNMNFNVGNIFKAAYRMGHKDGVTAEYDLDKIIWFAQQEKRRLKRYGGR